MKNPTIRNTIEGLTWYIYFLRDEDVSEPPKEQVIDWLHYAAEVLEAFQNHPDIKKEYE